MVAWIGSINECHFDPEAGLRWLPYNTAKPRAQHVNNVPLCHPSDRLQKFGGSFWRKSEQSFSEIAYLVETYCPPAGRVLDDCGGTCKIAMAALRTGRAVTCIEKDSVLADDARFRAKQ